MVEKQRDYDDFLAGLSTLITVPSRQTEPAEVAALEQAWWPELEDRRWIDGDLWLRAVRDAQTFCTFRPSLSEMLAVCEQVALEREAAREAAEARALPAPMHEDDPSTTPEERERWAREDAFIRSHMTRVLREWEQSAYLDDWSPHPTKPGVEVRTAPEDMAKLARSKRSDLAWFAVLQMTPEQRRARDRRIERAKGNGGAHERG